MKGLKKQDEEVDSELILEDPEVFTDLNSAIISHEEDLIDNMPDAHPEPKPTK